MRFSSVNKSSYQQIRNYIPKHVIHIYKFSKCVKCFDKKIKRNKLYKENRKKIRMVRFYLRSKKMIVQRNTNKDFSLKKENI